MRNPRTLLLLYLLCSLSTYAQTIDSLQTNGQVLAFLKKLQHEWDYKTGLSKRVRQDENLKSRYKQFGTRTMEKADFDDNGHTDLLFNGYADMREWDHNASLVVLAFGNDSFQVKDLVDHRADFFAARLITISGQPFIKTASIQKGFFNQPDTPSTRERTDTLQYMAGEFIERSIPENYNIEQVKFCFLGGPGSSFSPFNINMQGDSATFQRERIEGFYPTADSGGLYKTRLESTTRDKIMRLLQYMHFPILKDQYAGELYGHHTTGILHITYNGGKTKKIVSIDVAGPYALKALQQIFWEFGRTQHWILVDASAPFSFCPDILWK